MPKITIPPRRPRLPREKAEDIIHSYNVGLDRTVFLFIRGYYLDSMGKFGKNDIGVYDDYAGIISPTVYKTYNANTDPSKKGRGLAMINEGVHEFAKGYHNISKGKSRMYKAFRYYPEGTRVPCTRDGRSSTARFINIHRGGYSSTWSAGCLTIPMKPMWLDFRKLGYAEMSRYDQKTVQVVLAHEKDLR